MTQPLILGVALMLLGGCVEYRVVYDGWANFPQDPKPVRGDKDGKHRGNAMGYSVRLGEFEGPNRHEQAYRLIQTAREQSSLVDLWLSDIDGKSVVQVGRFRRPDDMDAQFALRQAREATVNGEQLFKDATLIPITFGSREDVLHPWNLRQFAGFYSLQIGYYDEHYGEGRRAAAESAVSTLRDEGQEAYYYHGPHRSLVCLGLYTDEDFQLIGQTHVYGEHIRQLQEKYPHNLGNGRTVIEKHEGGDKTQSSFLVRVF